MNQVIFFNHFHNGDIHVSRGFIRQIMTKMPHLQFSYSHRNSSNLLSDIPNLHFDAQAINNVGNEHISTLKYNNVVYFNTWYAQQHFKHMNKYNITIDTLYAAFDENCKTLWNLSLEDISTNPKVFFPSIDYSKYEISSIQNWLTLHPEKKIFIETAQALSGQAHNFHITPIIIPLAQEYKDITFILSNSEGNYSLPNNVIYSSSIIKKNQLPDLNENSYLSNYCSMIIGRASGVFTFTLTQENLFNRNTKFICLSNLIPKSDNKFWINDLLKDKIEYSAHFIVTDDSNTQNIYNLIKSNL